MFHPLHLHWLKAWVRLLHIHSSISCLVATSWACLRAVLPSLTDRRRNRGSLASIPAAVAGSAEWLHSLRSQKGHPTSSAKPHGVQSKNWKCRTVRFGRDFPNCSMHNVSEIFKRRNILLHMWCVCVLCCRQNRQRTETRSHFGSRAISVQVNIVAVSYHVFHRFLLVSCSLCLHIFALASCLNRALLMHLAHRFLTHPCRFLLRILVLFVALAPTPMVWAPALVSQRMRSSTPSFHSLHNSKSRSHKFLLSRLGCPVWIHISRKHLGILRLGLQRSTRTSAPSLHVCAKSRHMLLRHQMYQVQQDPGLHSNKLTAPQLLGPMAQDHLVTTETRDADLIFPQTLMMSMREVPSCYGSHANNTTKGLRSGSIIFAKNPICRLATNLSELIARQFLCQTDLFLEHEVNVKTLLLDRKTMVFLMRLTVLFAIPKTTFAVRHSRSIEDREIGKQFAPFWRVLADQLNLLFPDGDDEGAFIVPALGTRSKVLSIKGRRNGIGKPVFKLASLGSGQTFTLVAPDLSVPGASTKSVATGSLSSQHGQCMMAALSPPRLFAAWRVEAPFSAASLFDGF